jgi:predicted DCC family thiol-disulfide oxidoreductase YuxK
MKQENQSPVLFFDGVCGLCNRFVQFLFAIDKRRVFKVATLQGTTAEQKIPANLRENLTSLVVLTRDGRSLTKSRAVRHVFCEIGGFWRVVYFLTFWMPSALLDPLYDALSAHRYRWFGKLQHCRLPTVEERGRFLD